MRIKYYYKNLFGLFETEQRGDRSGRQKGGSLPADPPFATPHGLGVVPEAPRSMCIMKDITIKNAIVF